MSCTPGAIRTRDLQLRRLSLYPAELRAHIWQYIADRVKQIPTNNFGILKMSTAHTRTVRRTFWELRAHLCLCFENQVKETPIDNIGIAQLIYETIPLITTDQPHRNEKPEPLGIGSGWKR